MAFRRASIAGTGLILAGVVAFAVLGGEEGRVLCENGHPVPRSQHVTYGGLEPRHGYERDHIVPLCLGGADMAANVQYQPWPEARAKDEREWQACRAYCSGQWSLQQAKDYVLR